MLTQMWFSLYTRDVRDDSCGFEHVFVGESKEGKIVGFHNWLQFYLEEKKGAVNYTGYLLPRGYSLLNPNYVSCILHPACYCGHSVGVFD